MGRRKKLRLMIASIITVTVIGGNFPGLNLTTFADTTIPAECYPHSTDSVYIANEVDESTCEDSQNTPINTYWFDEYSQSQYIIPSSELAALNGKEITGLMYYYTYYGSQTYTTTDVQVNIKEVDYAYTSEDFDSLDGATVIYTAPLTFSSGDGCISLKFSQPFSYHGGNLLIDVQNLEPGNYHTVYYWGHFDGYNRSVSGSSGSSTEISTFLPMTVFFYQDTSTSGPGWYRDGSNWKYNGSDGNPIVSDWVYSGGKWYYLNSSGYMVTGWNQIGGKWYYFESNGAMKTGWFRSPGNGKWYYLHPQSGQMMTNTWASDNGSWYYLGSDGTMTAGWKQIGGKWYYFNPTGGAMVKGWKVINGQWYYFNPNGGAMVTGWVAISGKWYYCMPNGAMKTGWLLYNGDWYYFFNNGEMVIGELLIGDEVFYFTETGAMASG